MSATSAAGRVDLAATPQAAATGTLIARVRAALESRAARCGHRLRWISVASAIRLAEAPDEDMERNIVAQCEAALTTVMICVLPRPLSLVFLLNQSGVARGPESLMHGGLRTRITEAGFIASCEMEPARPSDVPPPDDAVVLWIDDLTVPTPFVDPYANRIKSALYRRAPALLDTLRQRRTDRLNRRMRAGLAPLTAHVDELPAPATRAASGRPTILFCLYWLDFGGAEAFALETIRAAHQAGYRVVVACDEVGRHRVLQRARSWADTIYLIGSFGHAVGWMEALTRIARAERPDILHIHHSWTAYRLLPTFRTLALVRRVVDTTHIIEHRFGGFPKESALYAGYIDVHHVISRDLRDFLVRDCRVPDARVHLGTLHDMARHFAPASGKWASRTPLRIVFVGRFVQQKRPYLFLDIARALSRGRPDRYRFQAVGEGELRPLCEKIAAQRGLAGLVEFLPGAAPVADILAHAHVVVICSDNEGLTLVAYEAMRADCLVISADVGGQRELVDRSLLLERHARPFVQGAVRLLRAVSDDSLDPAPVLDRQRAKLEIMAAEPSGTQICLAAYDTSHAPDP